MKICAQFKESKFPEISLFIRGNCRQIVLEIFQMQKIYQPASAVKINPIICQDEKVSSLYSQVSSICFLYCKTALCCQTT